MSTISVIIPVYNVEKYLEKCLNSVIRQTLEDIEIICVNDGSTDNSQQILKEYAQKDERIKIVDKKNGGLSSARNAGLDAATGEYCYFLDSDDWIELNTLEKLYKIIITESVDTVVHSAINIPEDDSCIEMANDCQKWFDSFRKENGIYDVPIEINRKIPTVAWNKLYRMDIINKYHCRFPEGLVNEDELFIWTYMIHCKNYYYLDEKLYNYLRRSDSIMGTRDNSPKVLDILGIEEEIYKIVKKYKNIKEYHKYLTKNYINTVKELFHRMPDKYGKEALKRIKQYYEDINNDKKIIILYWKYKYKNLSQFMQEIFSIKNIKNDTSVGKQIKLFGLKFKFKNKYKTLLNIIDDKIYACDNQINLLQNQINYANERLEKLYHISKEIANTDIIPNKIVFNNFNGKGYGCNPKYIAEEIIRQKLPYELVWLVKDVDKVKEEFPKEIKLVEWTVENAIREFSSAKVWISNQRMPQLYENGLFKKKDQYYIQTWHGSLGIKKCEQSVEDKNTWWCNWSKVDSKYIDCLTSNSKFLTNLYNKDFYYNGKICEYGNPRNDIFFLKTLQKENIRIKVCNKLSIPYNKKIVLYAPTFRNSDYNNKNFSIYEIDNMENILLALKNKFGTDWIYAIRLHPNISNIYFSNLQNSNEFINASLYTDMQELLIAADVLITDYSSCIYDFILTKKPAFIYARDLELYNNSTGLYYSLFETPFSISENSDQLINCINNFNQIEYSKKVDNFINKMGCIDKGTASKSVVSLISKIIK